VGRGVDPVLPSENGSVMFNGDIRLQRVERVMRLVRVMTLAEMRALYSQIAQHHDSIVLASDPKWIKPK
jgi:hypothetical protein